MRKVARDGLDKSHSIIIHVSYIVNLSPSVIIRDAVIVKCAVMQQTKRVTFMHTFPLIFFFLSFSKIFMLAHYRDYTFGHSSSLSVIVGHCRSLQVIVDHCRSLQVIVDHCRSFQVIPCFSNYVGERQNKVKSVLSCHP